MSTDVWVETEAASEPNSSKNWQLASTTQSLEIR